MLTPNLPEDQSQSRPRGTAGCADEERLRLIQQATGVGTWDWDIPGDRVVWDDACWTMLGYAPREQALSYEQWKALVHPADLPGIEPVVQQGVQAGGRFVVDLRYLDAGGGWRWVQGRGQVVGRDAAGAPLRMMGTHTDIHEARTAQEEARALYERLNKIAAHVPGVVYQYRLWPDGRSAFPYASEGMRAIYGVAPEAVAEDASAVFSVIHEDDLARVGESIRRSAERLAVWRDEYRVHRPDGTLIWVEGEASPEALEDGSILWHGYIRDVTDHKALALAQAADRQRLGNILWGTGVGTWEWNVQTGEARFNERWAEMIGYSLAELAPVGIHTWQRFAHPDDLAASAERLAEHFSGAADTYECEARMHHRDGHWIWVLDRGRVVSRTADGRPEWMAGTHLDITARKTAELRLQHLAHHDPLTGLPTRSLLADRLHHAMAQAHRRDDLLAVAYVDLDGFKTINDSYGHEAGDLLLKTVASRMVGCVREGDTVARIGGDEFVVLLTDLAQRADAAPLVERLLAVCADPVELGLQVMQVSCSIGVVFFGRGDQTGVDELLRQADQAMYRAKQRGRNRWEAA